MITDVYVSHSYAIKNGKFTTVDCKVPVHKGKEENFMPLELKIGGFQKGLLQLG